MRTPRRQIARTLEASFPRVRAGAADAGSASAGIAVRKPASDRSADRCGLRGVLLLVARVAALPMRLRSMCRRRPNDWRRVRRNETLWRGPEEEIWREAVDWSDTSTTYTDESRERVKGAAGFRCRQLGGRAAILTVVARPGGCELSGSVCGSFVRRLCGISRHSYLSSSQGARSTPRGPAHVPARSTPALAPVLPAHENHRACRRPSPSPPGDDLSQQAAFRRSRRAVAR